MKLCAFPRRARLPRPWKDLLAGMFAAAAILAPAAAAAGAEEEYGRAAVREVNRVRGGMQVNSQDMKDISRYRTSYGRPAMEVEGWERTAEGNLWPVDQATFDIRSGLLSKYVNFSYASRRKAGEAILPMGSMSNKGDLYLRLFYPGSDLALEGIDRYRVSGKESVYYELRYSPQPREVLSFHPLVRMLVDASTGRLYRFELAADYLGAGALPEAVISGAAAARIAGLYLQTQDLDRALGRGASISSVLAADLYFVRPNSWLGGEVPAGGVARPAWVVPFLSAGRSEESPHLLFVDAATGRAIGGTASAPP
jgi:hypothetical protein